RQTAAADAHFGVMKTWDYYANTYQRYGIDNKHYRMLARVHYGASNYAFWNGKSLAFGDNGGNAFVSMDLVGHEYTHGVFEKALGVDAQHQHLVLFQRLHECI